MSMRKKMPFKFFEKLIHVKRIIWRRLVGGDENSSDKEADIAK